MDHSSRFRAFLLALMIFACSTFSHAAEPSLATLSRSFEQLTEKVKQSVVQIFVTTYDLDNSRDAFFSQRRASGSGVILDSSGYIVTNAHLLAGARSVQVLLPFPGSQELPRRSILKPVGKAVPATIVGIDEETDIAVLKIAEAGLTAISFGDSDELKPGQLVLAFGSPLGLENSVSMGIISGVARQLQAESPMIYIQTDAAINPGNSGGPLVDTNGRVVGINTMIFSQSGGDQGLGFAAPSNIVKNVYEQIRSTGHVYRGEIGALVQTITPTLAKGLNLSQNWGVVIGDVYPGGSAERAGLQIGDVILTLDGKVMENARQFDVNLYRRAAGTTVKIAIQRGNERMELPVNVVQRPNEADQFRGMITPERNLIAPLGVLGLEWNDQIAKLLPRVRKQYGVVVAARTPNAPYWVENLRPGDIIHAINGTFITSIDQLRSLLSKMKPGDAVVLQIERQDRLMYVSFQFE